MRTIETGTVQYGLKLISTIRLLMSGDARSGLPTTAVWRDTATPPSIASMCAAGMLQTHEAGAEIAAHAAQPHQVGAQLREPHRRRHVERLERLLAHHCRRPTSRGAPGSGAPPPRHRNRRRRSRRHWHRGRRRRDQALAQRDDARVARLPSRSRSVFGTSGQPPLRDDALVMRDRLLGVLHGRGRQRRQRRLRHLDGARGGIEALAEVAALAF